MGGWAGGGERARVRTLPPCAPIDPHAIHPSIYLSSHPAYASLNAKRAYLRHRPGVVLDQTPLHRAVEVLLRGCCVSVCGWVGMVVASGARVVVWCAAAARTRAASQRGGQHGSVHAHKPAPNQASQQQGRATGQGAGGARARALNASVKVRWASLNSGVEKERRGSSFFRISSSCVFGGGDGVCVGRVGQGERRAPVCWLAGLGRHPPPAACRCRCPPVPPRLLDVLPHLLHQRLLRRVLGVGALLVLALRGAGEGAGAGLAAGPCASPCTRLARSPRCPPACPRHPAQTCCRCSWPWRRGGERSGGSGAADQQESNIGGGGLRGARAGVRQGCRRVVGGMLDAQRAAEDEGMRSRARQCARRAVGCACGSCVRRLHRCPPVSLNQPTRCYRGREGRAGRQARQEA